MITTNSITSRNQGQIFGSKPSMEEFERQLEADPSFKAYTSFCRALTKLGSRILILARLAIRSVQLLRFLILKMKTAQDVM